MSAPFSIVDGLYPRHFDELHIGSGISVETIKQRGYSTAMGPKPLKDAGFSDAQQRWPGLLIPLWCTDGTNGLFQYKPDNPRLIAGNKPVKYETPLYSSMRLDVPPAVRHLLGDPTVTLYVTEGVKKADALATHGLCVVGLLGVWSFRGPNILGEKSLLADWKQIALQGREVYVVFDSDVMVKDGVQKALSALTAHLEALGASVKVIYLPSPNGAKVGVDDFLVAHSLQDFQQLPRVELQKPAARKAPRARFVPNPALPMIFAGENHLPTVTKQGWDALVKANNPVSFVTYAGRPCRLQTGDDGVILPVELDADKLRHEVACAANWFHPAGDDMVAAKPPADVVRDMLAVGEYPLPVLERIVQVPVLASDGSIQLTPGYHQAGKTFYRPTDGLVIPDVPDIPEPHHMAYARCVIEELLYDFPFATDADRANAVGLLLTPFVRAMIDGQTPIHLIEAPTEGTGKGLLATCLLKPSLGESISVTAECREDDEWRKRITTLLLEGKGAIQVDNISRPLTSPVIAAAVTAPRWTDRLLGQNTSITVPVRCVWVATGNNPVVSGENARRIVPIRLVANVEKPWERDGFRHELPRWADENRADIVWSALTLIQNWLSDGRPPPTGCVMGSYEDYVRVVGGILQSAGIPGFLKNRPDFGERTNSQGEAWKSFVEAWYDKYGETEVGTSELFALALDTEGFELAGKTDAALKTSFGMSLAKQRDRIIAGYEIAFARKYRRASLWKCRKLQ